MLTPPSPLPKTANNGEGKTRILLLNEEEEGNFTDRLVLCPTDRSPRDHALTHAP